MESEFNGNGDLIPLASTRPRKAGDMANAQNKVMAQAANRWIEINFEATDKSSASEAVEEQVRSPSLVIEKNTTCETCPSPVNNKDENVSGQENPTPQQAPAREEVPKVAIPLTQEAVSNNGSEDDELISREPSMLDQPVFTSEGDNKDAEQFQSTDSSKDLTFKVFPEAKSIRHSSSEPPSTPSTSVYALSYPDDTPEAISARRKPPSIASPREIQPLATLSENTEVNSSAHEETLVGTVYKGAELDSDTAPQEGTPSIESPEEAEVVWATHLQNSAPLSTVSEGEVTPVPRDSSPIQDSARAMIMSNGDVETATIVLDCFPTRNDKPPVADVDTTMVDSNEESKNASKAAAHDTAPVTDFDISRPGLSPPSSLPEPVKVFQITKVQTSTPPKEKSNQDSAKASQESKAEPATPFNEILEESPVTLSQKKTAKSATPPEDEPTKEIDVFSQQANENFTAAPEAEERTAVPQSPKSKAPIELKDIPLRDSNKAAQKSDPASKHDTLNLGIPQANHVTGSPLKDFVMISDDDVVDPIIPIFDLRQDFATKPVRKSKKANQIVIPRPVAMPPFDSNHTFSFPRFKKGKVYIALREGDEKYTYRLEANVLTKASKWFAGALPRRIHGGEPDAKMGTKWSADNGGLTHIFDLEYISASKLWKLRKTTRSIRLEEIPKKIPHSEARKSNIPDGAEVMDPYASKYQPDEYSTGFSCQSELRVSTSQGRRISANSTTEGFSSVRDILKRHISQVQEGQDDGAEKSPKRQCQADYSASNDLEMVDAPQTRSIDGGAAVVVKTKNQESTDEQPARIESTSAHYVSSGVIPPPPKPLVVEEKSNGIQPMEVDAGDSTGPPRLQDESIKVSEEPETNKEDKFMADVVDVPLNTPQKESSQAPDVQTKLHYSTKPSRENIVSNGTSLETNGDLEEIPPRKFNERYSNSISLKESAVSAADDKIHDDVMTAQRGPSDELLNGFDNLFRTYHNLPVNISIESPELAINQVELLFNMATLYGLPASRTEEIRKELDGHLTSFSDAPQAIKVDPWRWLYISMFLRSPLIFKEAMIHIVGQQSHHPVDMPSHVSVPDDVQLTIARKVEQLGTRKEIVNAELLNLSIPVEGIDVLLIRRGVEYDAHHYWHDWYKKKIKMVCANRERGNNTDALTYRVLGKGQDSYLREDDVLAEYKEYLSGHGDQLDDIEEESRFKAHLSAMKEAAREIVRQLVKNRSNIKKNLDTMPYLTCTEVADNELPWKSKDFHPYFSCEGDDSP